MTSRSVRFYVLNSKKKRSILRKSRKIIITIGIQYEKYLSDMYSVRTGNYNKRNIYTNKIDRKNLILSFKLQ